jgi:hypothetical protein
MAAFLRNAIIFLVVILGMPATFFAQPQAEVSNASCSDIEEAKTKYLAANLYSEFIDFLNNFNAKKNKLSLACLDYYKAEARYLQLKNLEEKQSWDDYFANGNTYREQLVQSAQKAINQPDCPGGLKVKSRLLLWQFHNDQQDALTEQSLTDLLADAHSYATGSNQPDLLREVADKLLAYGEKSPAREIYKLYVNGLVSQEMTEEQIKSTADDFYKQGNLELAESIYDIYIEKISKSLQAGKIIPSLFEIANLFVCKPAGLYDMAYAEKIYAKIDELGQLAAFSQETIYLRAFNLEKMGAYQEALKFYSEVVKTSTSEHFEEATYKIAMINAYCLADVGQARKSFEILAALPVASPHVLSSFYQLGLLAQWQADTVKAGGYYELLLEKAQNKNAVIIAQASARLKEIQENQPLNYNLKMFLDLSLKNDSKLLEMNKAELKPAKYILEKNEKNTVSALVSMPQSGCNQVDLQYLWSGDLGGANPSVTESNFEGAYADAGTKDISIVIISPAGAIDRYFMMVDVY